jgi:hypothetical protein
MKASKLPDLLQQSRRHWFLIALLFVFVGLSVQYSFKAMHPKGTRSAILRWREQFQAWDGGEDIFQRYPNPPIMALILKPFTELEPLVGALSWFYLKVGLTLISVWMVFRMIEGGGVKFPPWAKAVTMLLSLRPIMGDLSHGNVNLFILFLVVSALFAYVHKRDLLSGVLIGLAVACKVTPLLFLPYFVWKRAWKAVAGTLLGLVLFFVLVPSAFLGWQNNWKALDSWTRQMIVPFVVQGTVTSEHNNQSLPGLVQRLLTHSPSFSTYEGHVYKPLEYHNVATLEPRVAGWLVKGCLLLFAGLFIWVGRTPRQPISASTGWRLAAEFSLILLAMLLFSERTWKHHCVTLLLPFGVLTYYVAVFRPNRLMRGYLIGTLTTVGLLMLATGTLQTDRDTEALGVHGLSEMAQVYGAYVWSYLLMIIALTVVLRMPVPSTHLSEGALAKGTMRVGTRNV